MIFFWCSSRLISTYPSEVLIDNSFNGSKILIINSHKKLGFELTHFILDKFLSVNINLAVAFIVCCTFYGKKKTKYQLCQIRYWISSRFGVIHEMCVRMGSMNLAQIAQSAHQ